MALTIYAALTANRTALAGDVSQAEFCGVDVSADHIEIFSLELGVGTGWEGTSAGQASRRSHRPITLQVRGDQTMPLFWQALVENQQIGGTIKLFDNATEAGGDGLGRHRFNFTITDGRVIDVQVSSPDAFSGEASHRPITTTIKLIAAELLIEDLVKSTSFVDNWRVQR
jgi:type VI protein secretion system component Hcp